VKVHSRIKIYYFSSANRKPLSLPSPDAKVPLSYRHINQRADSTFGMYTASPKPKRVLIRTRFPAALSSSLRFILQECSNENIGEMKSCSLPWSPTWELISLQPADFKEVSPGQRAPLVSN
jgi:hypothetical protein